MTLRPWYGELRQKLPRSAKQVTQLTGSRRRVPLPVRAAQALETLPRSLTTPLVFPGARGNYIDRRKWRKREWKPGLEAAGLFRSRRPYDLRHSYAAWSLAAGVPAHDLARYMGTSLRMINLTYGHLVRGSEEAARARLDAFTYRRGRGDSVAMTPDEGSSRASDPTDDRGERHDLRAEKRRGDMIGARLSIVVVIALLVLVAGAQAAGNDQERADRR